MIGLDAYSIPARFFPALLVVLPLGLVAVVLFPQDLTAWGVGTSTAGTTGLAYLMAEIARRPGRAVQDRLYAHLGAKPTTILLRHRDSRIDSQTKARYHNCLARLVPGVSMPTPEEEAADPDSADATYESCTRYLLEATRDKKQFPLVFKENVSYGMIRNLRGMKPAAVVLSGGGAVACAARALWPGVSEIYAPAAVAAAGSVFLLAVWLVRLNDRWVEEAAFDYARALLASCDKLASIAKECAEVDAA